MSVPWAVSVEDGAHAPETRDELFPVRPDNVEEVVGEPVELAEGSWEAAARRPRRSRNP